MSVSATHIEWSQRRRYSLAGGRYDFQPNKGWVHHHDIRLWWIAAEVLRKAAGTQQAGCCPMQFNVAATPASKDE
jgi:hypothetical protein